MAVEKWAAGALSPGSLGAGALAFNNATASTLTLVGAGPSGGTAPYSRTLYRSTSPGFIPPDAGIAVAASSSSGAVNWSVSPPSNGVNWYRERVVDAASAAIMGNETPACLYNAPLNIGFIGDSITQGTNGNPTNECAIDLSQLYGPRKVTMVNRGQSGTATADWQSSGATSFGPQLGSAMTAFAAAGVSYVHVMLGTNDSMQDISAATYGSNLAAMASTLVGAGYKIILVYPPYLDYTTGLSVFTAARVALLQSYQLQIDALVDGVNVFAGDKSAWRQFAQLAGGLLSVDGIHPSPAGNIVLGKAWASAIALVTALR